MANVVYFLDFPPVRRLTYLANQFKFSEGVATQGSALNPRQ